MTDNNRVAVTPADREREVNRHRLLFWGEPECEEAVRLIRSGAVDFWTTIQRDARLRIAALTQQEKTDAE